MMQEKKFSFKSSSKKHQPKGLIILHEDQDLIVVNKINGLLTVSTDREKDRTAILPRYLKNVVEPAHIDVPGDLRLLFGYRREQRRQMIDGVDAVTLDNGVDPSFVGAVDLLEGALVERRVGARNPNIGADHVLHPVALARCADEFGADLRYYFIVSSVAFGEAGEGAATSERFPGLKIQVERAAGNKCERCWMYSTRVGEVDALPGLCERCTPTVEGLLSADAR